MKTCTVCETTKPLTSFYKMKTGRLGVGGWCKSCTCKYESSKRINEPLYAIWNAMMSRCYNKANKNYNHYGERGVFVCNDWHLYTNFKLAIEALGAKPFPKNSLDRIDNDKGYEAGNVRWASQSAQCINQRMRKDNKSGISGVSFIPSDRKWLAQIQRNKIKFYIGRYNTREEASKARQNWIISYRAPAPA